MISCPVCNKENEIDYGKYICSSCNSKFEYYSNGKIEIIKRKKIDYFIFLVSIIFPLLFVILYSNEVSRINFFIRHEIFSGILMIFYPFLITLRQVFFQGTETRTLIGLYVRFFQGKLKREDAGRIIGFYLTLTTNVFGIIWILKGVFE